MSEIKIDPEQLKKLADVYQQAEDEAENTLKELKWDTSELMLTLTLSSTGRIRDLQSELNHSIETYRQKVDETQEAVMIARAAIQSADRSMAEHFGVFGLELLGYYDFLRINPENEFDPTTGEKLSDFDRNLAFFMLLLTVAPPAKAAGIAAKMGIKGVKTYLVREGAYLIRSAKNVMNPKVLIEMGKRAFTATQKGPIAKTAQGVKDHIKDMKKIGYTLKYLGGNVEDLLVLEKVGPDIIEETAKNKSAKEIMEMIKDKALSNIEKAKETLVRFGGKGKAAGKVHRSEVDEVIKNDYDINGNLINRSIVPKGYESVEDFLKVVDDTTIKEYGYDSIDEFKSVIGHVDDYLNASPKNNIVNKGLAGGEHVKGVDYDVLGFPIFKGDDVKFTLKLQENLFIASDDKQFKVCTGILKEAIEKGDVSRELFTAKQLAQINAGKPRIQGLTWHHHQVPGKLQLVNSKKHDVNHLGGNKLWGDGMR
ncbi:HNH endonuclease [Rossellomorea marisflavi]|uniref:HNH endonuclease n=1 Tax=Rossellomorea marisflavi TaxID=189381 RepID=UPI001EE34370|nr:HNH endonuclease [Rossellomorea marisflavi]UKS64957.1 HNH endonuclease [Rossellomorea marisflavi]